MLYAVAATGGIQWVADDGQLNPHHNCDKTCKKSRKTCRHATMIRVRHGPWTNSSPLGVGTIRFHGQERNSATEPSLCTLNPKNVAATENLVAATKKLI